MVKMACLYPDLSVYELIAVVLDSKDNEGKPNGFYLGSPRTIYRVLQEHKLTTPRNNNKGRKHNFNKKMLTASGPNQFWVWDII